MLVHGPVTPRLSQTIPAVTDLRLRVQCSAIQVTRHGNDGCAGACALAQPRAPIRPREGRPAGHACGPRGDLQLEALKPAAKQRRRRARLSASAALASKQLECLLPGLNMTVNGESLRIGVLAMNASLSSACGGDFVFSAGLDLTGGSLWVIFFCSLVVG